MDVSSSCLEHLVCDKCWNVHLRGREESGGDGGKGGIEGRRGEDGNKHADLNDNKLLYSFSSCHLSCSLEESRSSVSNGNTNFILK